MNSLESSEDSFLRHPLFKRYEPVIGLEVHCQLATVSKLFCRCPTTFGEEPNHNTCPVCLGLPGTLPVLNKTAVDFALKMALSVGGRIAEKSVFARKQYFYPDLPKGYQISQFDLPYCEGGQVPLGNDQYIPLTRIHIEEDAGKSVHGDNGSFVDLNRAGIPLIEIVSEPALKTPLEAVNYLKNLRAIARYLEITDGNMEQGSFRCDANVSIRPKGQQELGTRTEIKNLNSFRNIEKAITYEIFRQIDIVEDHGEVSQQTMLFDAASGKTSAIRSKEDSHDYRYFPDPDLKPLIISESRLETMKAIQPELPLAKANRFRETYNLPESDAHQLTLERDLADFFEDVVESDRQLITPKIAANWILSELLGVLASQEISIAQSPISSGQLAGLLRLIGDGTISGKIAKKVFEIMVSEGGDPDDIVASKGLVQVSDTSEIRRVAEEIIEKNPKQLEDFLSGKEKVFGFFVGQLMKAFQGKCNPEIANRILREIINERAK